MPITPTVGQLIPRTKARLSPYIRIWTFSGGTFIDRPEEIANLLSATKDYIGVVQKLTIKNDRAVNYYRELDAESSGRIIEAYPGLPEYNLTLDRVVLYKNNIQEAFGFAGYDVLEQHTPVFIGVDLLSPKDINGNPIETVRTRIYYGCWFKNNPIEFDISDDDDLRIEQSVDVVATGVVEATT